jgi:hypothetical protein
MIMLCDIRDNGGCYCACRMHDQIGTIKSVIAGMIFNKGTVYVPDYINHFAKLSPERQAEELAFREEMKILLPIVEKKFKEKYEYQNKRIDLMEMTETEKTIKKAHKRIEKIIHELESVGVPFPSYFGFKKSPSHPQFEVAITKTDSDSFVDDKGQKWVKAE